MNDLLGVADGVVIAAQRTERRQNLIVDVLY